MIGQACTFFLKAHKPYIREEHLNSKGTTAKRVVAEFKNDNMKLVRQLAKFEVLNSAEVAKLFPKLEKEICEKSLVVSK